MSINNNEIIWDEEYEKLKKDNISNYKINNKEIFYKNDLNILQKALIFVLIVFILIPIFFIFNIMIHNSYSVKANELSIKYNITNIHNLIKLFDTSSSNIINSIASMEINGKKINPLDKYKFNKTGIYNIKIRLKAHLNTINHLFKNCKDIIEVDFTNFDMEKINNLSNLFSGCSSLKNIFGFNSFKPNKIKDMSYLFYGCSSLINIDLSSFSTPSVIYMQNMFAHCSKLTQINFANFNS